MSLVTGKQVHTYIWKEIPIHEQVMHRVDDLDTEENQPEMTKG